MTRYGEIIEVSNSEVQSFMDCGRRWWLSYFRGLRPIEEKPVGPLALGSRVHKALEEGYSTPGRVEAMFKVLADTIENDYPIAEAQGILKEFEKEAKLALIMLEGFADWAAEEGLDAGWEVLHNERIVRSPVLRINATDVVLKGKLDQMVRREMDGSVWMRDWKTTATMNPVMLAFGPQLKTYLLLLSLTEPDAQVTGGQFVFLKKVMRTAKAEPPFYSVEPMYVTSVEMENFWVQTVAVLTKLVETTRALEAGGNPIELVPPRPTRDCSWRCPFYSICPMFDDGSDVERYLTDFYKTTDPYAYYEDPDKEETTA